MFNITDEFKQIVSFSIELQDIPLTVPSSKTAGQTPVGVIVIRYVSVFPTVGAILEMLLVEPVMEVPFCVQVMMLFVPPDTVAASVTAEFSQTV